jgi:hypothetical protein
MPFEIDALWPLPCPACRTVSAHAAVLRCSDRRYGDFGLIEESVIEANCSSCKHVWLVTRRYSEPDTSADLFHTWEYPETGGYYQEFYGYDFEGNPTVSGSE